jgi:hypothetical protein
MGDFLLPVIDRPAFKELTSEEELEFLHRQAEFEIHFRRTGDSLVLFHALADVWGSRQTLPGWLMLEIGSAIIRGRTDQEAERHRELTRDVRRYACVESLRREQHPKNPRRDRPKDSALDLAVEILRGTFAEAARPTIEDSYDKVRKSLEREGRASPYFHLVQYWGPFRPDQAGPD